MCNILYVVIFTDIFIILHNIMCLEFLQPVNVIIACSKNLPTVTMVTG